MFRAHPRSRGEHTRPTPKGWVFSGSSPLARGTLPRQMNHSASIGLIPARAGNTEMFAPDQTDTRAHPRSRGEHGINSIRSGTCQGSSPLARGTHSANPFGPARTGLIPARAGNTWLCTGSRPGHRAHPRSRGEHAIRSAERATVRGSSPLARGTPDAETPVDAAAGLIPARAGNTHRHLTPTSSLRAHPRSRGEHRCF